MGFEVGRSTGTTRPHRARWLSAVVVAAALVLGGGMFALTRNVNARDQRRLLTAQAKDARTTITALITQIESTMSSVGSVAAATDGDPAAVNRLATADPSLDVVSALVVLHSAPGGKIAIVAQRGTPERGVAQSPRYDGRAARRGGPRRH